MQFRCDVSGVGEGDHATYMLHQDHATYIQLHMPGFTQEQFVMFPPDVSVACFDLWRPLAHVVARCYYITKKKKCWKKTVQQISFLKFILQNHVCEIVVYSRFLPGPGANICYCPPRQGLAEPDSTQLSGRNLISDDLHNC